MLLEQVKYEVLKNSLKQEMMNPASEVKVLMPEELVVVNKIREEIRRLNRNNLTRTRAYLEFFKRNPEIHWAFLAHMVSRNGGYHMTDLKGSAMNHIFNEGERAKYFLFLERANSAIFADAYPQLLLYEYSKENKIPFRKLMGVFHISRFMLPIWDHFFQERNSELVTIGLIINEQRMLQERVIKRNGHGELLSGIDFQLQEFFGFTTVIFPYLKSPNRIYRLAGLTVDRFAEPAKRILTGKLLYSMLFEQKKIFPGVYEFAIKNIHSGSRSDYWESVFTSQEGDGSDKIYSPTLSDAWADKTVYPLPQTDWFTAEAFIEDIKIQPTADTSDITGKVLENLRHIEVINEMKSII